MYKQPLVYCCAIIECCLSKIPELELAIDGYITPEQAEKLKVIKHIMKVMGPVELFSMYVKPHQIRITEGA
ncbi:hypothetical protein [Mesobacillus stamsii]|uniref:Uncharacterized protein n=2 Tax=Mesobacillus TaxID=2675231 RepID=A0A0D6ZDI1_9BACI|nr:hypothetical protein [Mesobacillus stamsii]KIY23126.1 hypothetical protein UB32_04550 [Mesobacillus subterraneus]MDQ0415281.1 hypothetical protein [Mesobacillus stamsii]